MSEMSDKAKEFEQKFKSDVKPVLRRFRDWVAGKPTAFWIMAVLALIVAGSVARWIW